MHARRVKREVSMHTSMRMALSIVSVLLIDGCRTATRVADLPRVDLDLTAGNRGYIMGTPPEVGDLKTTRQIMQTDIEIPTRYKPRSGAKLPADLPVGTTEASIEEPVSKARTAQPTVAGKFDTYAVQKGDSLWSIAAKPDIYGKATYWRRLLDANQDLLKGDPNRIRVGMTLKIPRGHNADGSTTYDDEGITYKK